MHCQAAASSPRLQDEHGPHGLSVFVDQEEAVPKYQVGPGSFVVQAVLDIQRGFGQREWATTFQHFGEAESVALMVGM